MVSGWAGDEPASRRILLARAPAALAGLLLAGCGSAKHGPTPPSPQAPTASSGQAELLNHLLDVEWKAVSAYTAGAPLLIEPDMHAARKFLFQELTHVSELGGLVARAGGKPHMQAASYALGHPHTSDDVLRLWHELEQEQITAYLDAIPLLENGKTRAACLAMLANDAQHISVLRGYLGESMVPSAFLSGSE